MAKITISIALDTADGDSLDNALGEMGYFRADDPEVTRDNLDRLPPTDNLGDEGDMPTGVVTIPVKATEYMSTTQGPDPKAKFGEIALGPMDGDRKRGEAGPGRRRRTNAQLEEDKRFFDQQGRAEAFAAVKPGTASISSGEPRVDPADAAQDAADEAAETATRPSGPPTLEDLRAAVTRYSDKFGPVNTVANIRGIIGCPVNEVPADQIGNAIAKVQKAIEGFGVITPNSPVDDKPVEPEPGSLFGDDTPSAPATVTTATKADIVEALKAYGRKYDGTDTRDKMPLTMEDCGRIFKAEFGEGCEGIRDLDQTPETFAKAVNAVVAATYANPFKREVRG